MLGARYNWKEEPEMTEEEKTEGQVLEEISRHSAATRVQILASKWELTVNSVLGKEFY